MLGGMVGRIPDGIVKGKPAFMAGERYMLGTGGTVDVGHGEGHCCRTCCSTKQTSFFLSLIPFSSVQLPAWPFNQPGGLGHSSDLPLS